MKHTRAGRSQPSKCATKGRTFESRVERALAEAKKASKGTLSYSVKPKIRLQNKETVIPDFRIQISHPHKTQQILLECQNRDRSSKPILHKIQHIRNKSKAKTFFFVYPRTIGDELARSLESEGIEHCNLSDLQAFLMAEARMRSTTATTTVVTCGPLHASLFRELPKRQLALNSHPDAKAQIDEFLAEAGSPPPPPPGGHGPPDSAGGAPGL